jgi:signal transduction histidine kinase
MAVLRSVIQKIAAVVRVFGVSYVVVQVAIWHAFFAAHPWFLAGPSAAVAWGLAAAAYLRRRRPLPRLIILDAGFYAALAISAGACVPPDMRGVAGNWLYIAVSSQVIATVWFAPRALAVLLSLVPEAAYWAGIAVTPPGPAQGNAPVVSGVLLLVVLAGHWTARGMLYRRAAGADLGFAAADQEAHDQYVVLSRNLERREHERLLHDTVLNTLTVISRGASGPVAVVARCRQDIALLEHVLTASGDPAATLPPGGAGVLADVEAVAREMRARGLRVHLETAGGAAGQAAASAGAQTPAPQIPAAVAGALVHATRAALANVAAHAGTGEAWVSVTLAAGALRVTVRDTGAGFDPARVDPARLGLRRSITERLTDRGGRASVRSAPGQGTLVSLSWPGTVPAAGADLVAAESSW